MNAGPIDIIGQASTAAFSSIKQKMKEIKKEASDANKEFEKAKKAAKEAGTPNQIDKGIIDRQRAASKKLSDFVAQVRNSNQRKRDFISERKEADSFDRLDDLQQRYNTIKSIYHTVKHSVEAFKDDTKNENIGKDINGNDVIIQTGHHRDYQTAKAIEKPAAMALAAAWKAKNPVALAVAGVFYGASKMFTSVQDAAYAEKMARALEPQGRLDFSRTGLGSTVDYEDIKGIAERDYLRKNSALMLVSESAARLAVKTDPEAVKAMHSAVESVVGQVVGLKQQAMQSIAMGDFQTYDTKMKEAQRLIPNEKISIAQDPMKLYTQLIQGTEATKSFARSQMARLTRIGD